MKVRVKIAIAGRSIDEIITALNADDLLAEAKQRVARDMGWKGMFLNAMGPLQFAQTAVRMYNENYKTDYPLPQTAEEFVAFGEKTGNLEVLER